MRAAQDPEMGLDAADVDALLRRGDMCVAAFAGDRMIAYVWRAFSIARWAPNVWVRFEKPYRYGFKGFTHPDFRGRRVSTALSFFSDRACAERGYSQAIALVEVHNLSSFAAEKHRQSVVVGYAGYVIFRGRPYPFRTRGVRKHTLRLCYLDEDSQPIRRMAFDAQRQS